MKFGGSLTSFQPQTLSPGDALAFTAKYKVNTTSTLEAINGWKHTITVTLSNGMSQTFEHVHFGSNKEYEHVFFFDDFMPGYDITANVLITCFLDDSLSTYSEEVVEEEILIETRKNGGSGGSGGSGGEETDLKKYLIPAAVGAGALILLAIAIGGKK